GEPVLSEETKKKELVGPCKNGGRTWRPKGKPHRVNVHDFPSLAEGKAIPYGAYEIGDDRAVVNVGETHDTAEFAVESIRRWWKMAGRNRKQAAKRILICADAGGSNSSRSRTWKLHLQDPLEGYRRLTFMMLDADVVAVSPSSVWRVLSQSGLLSKWNGKPSKKGIGFAQPLVAHEHWHIDVSYLNIGGTFYYLCSIL